LALTPHPLEAELDGEGDAAAGATVLLAVDGVGVVPPTVRAPPVASTAPWVRPTAWPSSEAPVPWSA